MKRIITAFIVTLIASTLFTIPAFASARQYGKSEYQPVSDVAKAKAQTVINSVITPNMDDIQKIKAVHDYIILTTAYDEVGFMTGVSAIGANSYRADGPILYGTGVCAGYSEAFKLYMDLLGIPCVILEDDILNHAWNQVTIAGIPYEIDVTWDDPIPDIKSGLSAMNTIYFLKTADEMKKLHGIINESVDSYGNVTYLISDPSDMMDYDWDCVNFIEIGS